ncbi:MAG: DNA double-strand break repair nuclease NurA [Anaerolineales bacterium]|jgi:hypothetical protein
MLHPEKIRAALSAKENHFTGAQRARSQELDTFQNALAGLCAMTLETANQKLSAVDRPGAKPTREFEHYEQLTVPFAERWSNHEQARAWAREILEGTTTFAVDGSQVLPTKEISIPVGLIQIGWFENKHNPDGEYTKDIAVEVLSPLELANREQGLDELGGAIVNLRRFEMESARLEEYLEKSADRIPKPLALFDGTLIISFAGLMQPELQSKYTRAIIKLLKTTEETHVPLIGFVDSSSAHDVIDMVAHLTDTRRGGQVTDAFLLQQGMQWGDRSQVFICARDDNLVDHDYYESVCFCYLKTTADLPPARIEFPRWLFDTGDYEEILDMVRAECIVGTGYPYALETADAVAVIDLQDRERFFRLVQRFTEQSGISLRVSRKSSSKRSRR